MYTNEVIRLHILSWVDSIAIAAQHYYAKILWRDVGYEEPEVITHKTKRYNEHELEYILDEHAAKRLNDSEPNDAPPYSVGATSHRFLCPNILRQTAVETAAKIVPHSKVMLVCDWLNCGPVEIVYGPKNLLKPGNKIWQKWEISEADDELCIQLENQWGELFANAGFFRADWKPLKFCP